MFLSTRYENSKILKIHIFKNNYMSTPLIRNSKFLLLFFNNYGGLNVTSETAKFPPSGPTPSSRAPCSLSSVGYPRVVLEIFFYVLTTSILTVGCLSSVQIKCKCKKIDLFTLTPSHSYTLHGYLIFKETFKLDHKL